MPVVVRSYVSPTLVLLAFDWPEGDRRQDFLGFAIQRTPGFARAANDWLPNRIGFDGPKSDQSDIPSNQAPIQKFYWWDARIDTKDRGSKFSYRIVPVTGTPVNLKLEDAEVGNIDVRVPEVTENGITTHFNRAVVSSQAFEKKFPSLDTASQQKAARAWLANGMEQAIPQFLDDAAGKDVEGAIYHLSDETWIIPALKHYGGSLSLAYNKTRSDDTSDQAIQELVATKRPESAFQARTHANIMHNKFVVRVGAADQAEAVLTGSANFTSEGLSAQANVLHVFESPELAELYLKRKRELDRDPTLEQTQRVQEGWSERITMRDAKIRVYFPPEGKSTRESLDAIVHGIRGAQHSVLMCAYDPTDANILNATFAASDAGKMVLALVNRVADKEPTGDPNRADVAAEIEIMKRSEQDGSFTAFGAFKKSDTPTDFVPERVLWPHENPKIMVRVHHKFVVIDAEGKQPLIYTGSANFSGNSLHKNDENLMEISECPRLAAAYLGEFLRLYEHYRARIAFERNQGSGSGSGTFKLTPDNTWSRKYFKNGSPEMKARVAMSTPVAG